MEEKQGIITEIIFHNEDNGYTIAVMETEAEYFTVVGCLPSCVKGVQLQAAGNLQSPSYLWGSNSLSPNLKRCFLQARPELKVLASGVIKGIGPKMAAAIVNLFGEETLEIMEHEPEKLSRVSGIGPKKAESIAESFAAHREFANVSMFFQEYGVSADYALKLYKIYGASATELIKENPYRLVEEVYGIGFRKADTIAEKMGIEKESTFRIHSGIKYGLSYYVGEGNTYMPQQELCEKVAELLDVSTELIYENMVTMAFEGDIQIDSLDGQTVVYLYLYYLAEQKVCKNIAAIAGAGLKALSVDIDSMIKMTEGETGIILSEQQITAVKSSLTSGVSVITGGPGTGKTTIINTIINIF